MPKEDEIITFESYHDPMLAHIVRTKLEANGVPCFLTDEFTIAANPIYNNALGGIKLKIFARDLTRCKEIVSERHELQASDHFEIDPETQNSIICPYCASTNVSAIEKTHSHTWMSLLTKALTDIWPFQQTSNWHCYNCNKDFV